MKKRIYTFIKQVSFLKQIPHYFWFFFSFLKAKREKRLTILVELHTTNEFFYLKSVLETLHQEKAFIIIFARPKLALALAPLVKRFFGKPLPPILYVSWIHHFPFSDFYINVTQSYDVEIPRKTRYKINFPHTITSKGKNDVFSPVLEQMTDSFNSGPAYTKDVTHYSKEMNFKTIPRMQPVGSPKSDSLFDHTINQKEFLKEIGLDPEKKTIMYAPTWNQEASLLEWLDTILEIPEKYGVNLIIKIHPGMYLDPTNKKSSGAIDWKNFLADENLRKKGIINAFETDSPDYIMASDVAITDISTIWIEYHFLRKNIIFLDVPEFFKKLGFNSLGDFREKQGYVVKNKEELDQTISGMLHGTIPKKENYDIDNLLLFNKGNATYEAVKKIKELAEEK